MLNLHRHALVVASARAVDLTEGGNREWLLVEGGKHLVQAGIEILLDDSAQAA